MNEKSLRQNFENSSNDEEDKEGMQYDTDKYSSVDILEVDGFKNGQRNSKKRKYHEFAASHSNINVQGKNKKRKKNPKFVWSQTQRTT